jgi:pimeloyl-ACP methyl ester carboxylesterase
MMTTTTDQHRRHVSHGVALAAAGLALGLAGCTANTHPDASTTTTTKPTGSAPGTSTAGDRMGDPTTITAAESDIVLSGRHFRARCDGSGPAVIDVTDYGLSMDDTEPYLRNVAPHAQVCRYDRLGEGRSDPARHTQTFASMADDLDGVITALGIARPLVLIGDSLGAPIALTWASRHQKDARAVVLTMPPPPGFMGPHGALSRLLPPRNPGDLELSSLWMDLDRMNNPAVNRESLDPRSWDAYLGLSPTSTPLYDLATPTLPWLASIDAKKVNDAWRQGQSRVLRLSSSSQLVTVTNDVDWTAAVGSILERLPQG